MGAVCKYIFGTCSQGPPPWVNNDLTTLAAAPNAAPGSALDGYQTLKGNEHLKFIGRRVSHASTPPKRTHKFLRVPDPSFFEGSGLRRSVAPEFLREPVSCARTGHDRHPTNPPAPLRVDRAVAEVRRVAGWPTDPAPSQQALRLIRCDCNYNANFQPTSTTRIRYDEGRKVVSIHCVAVCRFLYTTIACLGPKPQWTRKHLRSWAERQRRGGWDSSDRNDASCRYPRQTGSRRLSFACRFLYKLCAASPRLRGTSRVDRHGQTDQFYRLIFRTDLLQARGPNQVRSRCEERLGCGVFRL